MRKLEHKGFEEPPKAADWPLITVASVMVTLYLIANIMAVKLVCVCGVSYFDAGTITFPFVYMLGDVLTEIWGYATAKKVIWLTFFCNVIMITATSVGLLLPAPDYQTQVAASYSTIFTYVPRIVGASLVAFLAGELSNAWSMAKIKEWTNGRWLWMRTIGSSLLGYLFDTGLFVVLAFAGTAPWRDLVAMLAAQFVLKMAMEAFLSTPVAYGVIYLLRKLEKTGDRD